jgi:hypothetical protein
MLDVALSIGALIAGGFVLELFANACTSGSHTRPMEIEIRSGELCEEAGNPS